MAEPVWGFVEKIEEAGIDWIGKEEMALGWVKQLGSCRVAEANMVAILFFLVFFPLV